MRGTATDRPDSRETGTVVHHILAELQVPGERDEVRSISELEPTLADAHARGIAADGDQRVLAIVVEADGTTLPECGREALAEQALTNNSAGSRLAEVD